MEFREVQFCAVTFVLAEAIFRKARAEFSHNRIARNFCDHARGCDAEAEAITIDDGGLRQWKRKHRQAIDECMIGRRRKRCDRGPHRSVGGAQNVDLIDFERIDNADGPEDLGVIDQLMINLFAQLRCELFRVVQLPMAEFHGENHRGRNDRTG